MKKIIVMLSIIAIVLAVCPLKVSAAELKEKTNVSTALYGTITVMETDGWETKPDGGKFINQEYYITKTNNGYVYIELLETSNVKIASVLAGSNFEIVKETKTTNGVSYLLKVNNNATINSKTELFTVTADIVDPSISNCNLSFSPLSTSCASIDGIFFNDNSEVVTEDEYNVACNGAVEEPADTPEDEPNNPETGSVVPYIAVAGGLFAIAIVYLYSRKSNKIYKI